MNAHPIPTELDPRWQSVLARDAAQDGRFVYAVRSTGVYCRPSCPSRAAKPENVTFHAAPADAEAAGFRACLRCHPKGQSPAQANAAIVAEACRLIEAGDAPPRLDDLARRVGMSAHHFHRQFKAITGLTPREWGAAHLARKLRAGLDGAQTSVTEAIYDAGFNSNSRFYERADAVLGMTPSAYRKGGRDAEIRFALAQCALGAILVAQTARGICAISLGDDPETLFAPVRISCPPGNRLPRMVLPLSLDRDGITSARRSGLSSISGSIRCCDRRFARSTVGWTARNGPGARWMQKPTQLLPPSVAPTCAAFMNTTRWAGLAGESASMIPRI